MDKEFTDDSMSASILSKQLALAQYEKAGVPVFDVRKSPQERRDANKAIKIQNIRRGSKFFNSSYSLTGPSYNIDKYSAREARSGLGGSFL